MGNSLNASQNIAIFGVPSWHDFEECRDTFDVLFFLDTYLLKLSDALAYSEVFPARTDLGKKRLCSALQRFEKCTSFSSLAAPVPVNTRLFCGLLNSLMVRVCFSFSLVFLKDKASFQRICFLNSVFSLHVISVYLISHTRKNKLKLNILQLCFSI